MEIIISMNKEELKKYLKDNLSIDIEYGITMASKKLVLKLEGEKISSVNWPIF